MKKALVNEFGFTPDDLVGWNQEEDSDVSVHTDGVHRQRLPMTRRFGGYPTSFRGEFRDRTSSLPLIFPFGLGTEQYPAGRRPSLYEHRIDVASAERALVEMIEGAAVDSAPAAANDPKLLRFIVDCVVIGIFHGGDYDELHNYVPRLWKTEEARRAIIIAYRAARAGLAAVAASKGASTPLTPALSDLVN